MNLFSPSANHELVIIVNNVKVAKNSHSQLITKIFGNFGKVLSHSYNLWLIDSKFTNESWKYKVTKVYSDERLWEGSLFYSNAVKKKNVFYD